MPIIVPATSERKRTPSSTAGSEPTSGVAGTAVPGQMVKACAAIVILKALVVDWTGLPESVTRTVKLKAPATGGVPVIAPVLGFNVSPLGREPLASDHV